MVEWSGANALPQSQAVEIEFVLRETQFPMPAAMPGRPSNLVQLVAGDNGRAPSQSAYRAVREAGETLKRVSDTRQQVFLVSLPTFWPGQYGATQGRHYLVGVFTTDGTPIYLHPEAVGKVLEAEFPVEQKERSFAADSPTQQQPQVQEDWYRGFERALAPMKLNPRSLHEAILRARAQQLVDRGVAPDIRSGVAVARQDARTQKDGRKEPTKGQAAGQQLLDSLTTSLPKQRRSPSRTR